MHAQTRRGSRVLIFLVLSVGAGCKPAPDRAAPAALGPRPVAQGTSSSDPVAATLLDPPYRSISALPPHHARVWELLVGDVRHADEKHVNQVAEIRAVDLPVPASSPWECRLDHVEMMGNGPWEPWQITRAVACSNDGWKTAVTTTANYEEGAELDLREGRVPGGALVVVTLTARSKSSTPELP
jgi:hypothetical protein